MLEVAAQGAVASAEGAIATDVVPVLLIEDDEADAFLVREYLDDAGLPVALAWRQTMAAATPDLKAGPVCVLLDLGLPDSVGFEGLRRVIDLAPDAAVLVLTGVTDASLGIAAVAEGAQDYLVKGQVDGITLSRCIRYAIERKRANEASRKLHEAAIRQSEYARLERGLLPVPIVNDGALYHTLRYRPGRDQALLGGDFYDLVELGDGTVHTVIGDVCGHGPDEAALGAALRVAWRTLVLSGQEPDQIFACMQDVLERERHREEVFATVAMLTLNLAAGTGSLRLAGHPPPVLLGVPPVLLGDGQAGPPLGVFDDSWPLLDEDWQPIPVSLGEEWSLMLYTDGLIEGRGGPGKRILGCEGLLDLITASAPEAPGESLHGFEEALADTLVKTAERLNGEALADDVAVLVVGRHQ